MSDDSGCVGYNVAVKTKSGEVHTGSVWNYDQPTGLVVLKCPASSGLPGDSNVVVLRTSNIAEILSASPPGDPCDPDLPRIDLTRVQRREAKTWDRMEQLMQSIGVGVSEEAQALFDSLAKIMPCRWRGDCIEVFGRVVIAPPYGVDDCALSEASEKEDEVIMGRVVDVLREERARMPGGGAVEEEAAVGAVESPAAQPVAAMDVEPAAPEIA